MVTPMGPRDWSWLEAVADDPRQGIDIFPWWDEGVTPQSILGRVKYQMWQTVRWRASLTDDESAELRHLDHLLTKALSADPKLDYPWREWCEILLREESARFVSRRAGVEPEVIEHARATSAGPLIGYRRGPVCVELGDGWSMTIPGALVEHWEEDDSGLWSAWDSTRTIWFKSYLVVSPDTGEAMPAEQLLSGMALPEDGERFEHRDGPLIGGAVFRATEENGTPFWNLCARSALDGHGALCNIFLKNPADRDWALETWHGLEHARARPQ
jgi:hypothetical protein